MYSVCTQILAKCQETGPDKNYPKLSIIPYYYYTPFTVIQKNSEFLIQHDHSYIL